MIGALPRICAMHNDVDFLVGKLTTNLWKCRISLIVAKGGDGPKVVELEQMIEKHRTLLQHRVQLLGSIKHEEVRDVCLTLEQLTVRTADI